MEPEANAEMTKIVPPGLQVAVPLAIAGMWAIQASGWFAPSTKVQADMFRGAADFFIAMACGRILTR